MLGNRSAVGAAIGRTLEHTLERHPRLNEPTISDRHEKNGVELRVDHVVTSRDKAERPGITGQDGNRLLRIGALSGNPRRCEKQKKQSDAGPGISPPASERGISQ